MPNDVRSYKRFASALLATAVYAGIALAPSSFSPSAYAQNATTGSLTGTVMDSTGAVIPGATVKITDKATGATSTSTSNDQGRYSFNLVKPSMYQVVATSSGMSVATSTQNVLLGQSASLDITLATGAASETVSVSADVTPLVDTQSPALITTFSQEQVQNLPAPGGDITTVAFTVPGVVVNAGGAYGNFSADGLPGTSNLYVLNGFDDEDPFLNLNNSGSSNLTLGQGEVSEASVVLNGYSAQYGRAAGAIINYTTKSGANQFHGQANYYYNGDALNANDWFRNNAGAARQKAISNEWAVNGGGPIIKNKLFFFADYEGLRYVLPASGQAVFPSQQFEAYSLAHVPGDSLPLYQQAFALYNGSPSAKNAVPVTTGAGQLQDASGGLGCGGFAGTATGTGGTFGVDTPCETAAEGSASNTNKEYLFTARVDYDISDKHRLFGRFKLDRGTQPTYTSFVSPSFNVVSSQPEYEGQLNDTLVLTPHLTNQFVFATNWYTAFFGSANLAATLATFPTYLYFFDGAINTGADFGNLGAPFYFPEGRNVTQYQFVDDISYIRGKHTIRAGFNFRRDDISDYDAESEENGLYEIFSLADFANGVVSGTNSVYGQNFATQKTAYLALYNVGAYVQDEWQPTSRLRTTLGIRFDRTGNPLCNNNCFARYNSSFPQAGATLDTPYNQAVTPGLGNVFNGIESIIPQPRFGFNYDLTGNGRTVLRGGVGLFGDLPAAGFLDGLIQNFPQLYSATVLSGDIAPAGSPTSAPYYAAQSNIAIQSGFASGATANQIASTLNGIGAGVPFTPPNLVTAPNHWREAKYLEYNLQLQRQLGPADAIVIGYVGNDGYDELIQNSKINGSSATGFAGLPATSADPRFLAVNAYQNEANSNYQGVSVTYKHADRRGLTGNLTYTYSHSMDDISNGGEGEYYNAGAITQAVTPYGVPQLDYSNADYDIRNSLTADYDYQMPYIKRYGKLVNSVAGGWLFTGKTFFRSGQPFSVTNSGIAQSAGGGSLGTGQILAAVAPGASPKLNCQGNGLVTPCFTASQFETVATQNVFGNIRRNSFVGPHYSDSDFALSKKVLNTERANLQIGTYAFNVFNHPNFSNPSSDVNGGNVGTASSILAPPTSPYGSFQQAGIGGRVLQVFGKLTF